MSISLSGRGGQGGRGRTPREGVRRGTRGPTGWADFGDPMTRDDLLNFCNFIFARLPVCPDVDVTLGRQGRG